MPSSVVVVVVAEEEDLLLHALRRGGVFSHCISVLFFIYVDRHDGTNAKKS